MKSLLKLVYISVIFTIITISVILCTSLKHDAARYVIKKAISNDHFTAEIQYVNITGNKLTLRDIAFLTKNHDEQLLIEEVKVDYDIMEIIRNMTIDCVIDITKFRASGLSFDMKSDLRATKDSLEIVNGHLFFHEYGGVLKMKGRYNISKHKAIILDIAAQKVPLSLYKAFGTLFPNNAAIKFCRNFILSGEVSGDMRLTLDDDFFIHHEIKESSVTGKFTLDDTHIKYHEFFPVIRKIKADMTLAANDIFFDVKEGFSDAIKIHDSKVHLNIGKKEDTNYVTINAMAQGPFVEMLGFVSDKDISNLQKNGIDLTKTKGDIDIELMIKIPLNSDESNVYKADANVHNFTIGLFGDSVIVSNGKLRGAFDGNVISFDGTSMINDFPSKIRYSMNLSQDAKFQHILDARVSIVSSSKYQDHFISFVEGKANLDVKYTSSDMSNDITIDSNLQNIGFAVEKIGIKKPIGEKAYLKISGNVKSDVDQKLNISMSGANNLKMTATALFKGNGTTINFHKMQYDNTDIKASISLDSSSTKVNISGNQLDLSNVNMMRYLDGNTGTNSNNMFSLNINLSKIKLHNDIWLDNVLMYIKCDKLRCYDGSMESNVGSKLFTAKLDAKNHDQEKWQIDTTNAGAILHGLNLYDKIRSGNLALTIIMDKIADTNGKSAQIIQGQFEMSKFVTVNAPFLTRMISVTSFPGLMSAITDNKNISFRTFYGSFDYNNNVVNIKDSFAEGGFFNCSMKGYINTKSREIHLKGGVIPSLYGISSLVRNVPLLNNLVSDKGRRGLNFAPYAINSSY